MICKLHSARVNSPSKSIYKDYQVCVKEEDEEAIETRPRVNKKCNKKKPSPTPVKVFTIPVGQGDSTVIKCSNGDITIIDMGCHGGCAMNNVGEYVDLLLSKRFLNGDFTRLKHVFLTHPDIDHMNYAHDSVGMGLLQQWSNNRMGKTLPVYIGYKNGASKNTLISFLETAGNGFTLTSGPYHLEDIKICSNPTTNIRIIASDVSTASANAMSMVMSLMIGGKKKMLFMGDFEHGYTDLLKHYKSHISGHPVIMVPHHGSNTNGNGVKAVKFYRAVNPHIAIVSSALWSNHKHPKMETLQAICHNGVSTVVALANNNGLDRPNIVGWSNFDVLQELRRCQSVDMYQTTTAKWTNGQAEYIMLIIETTVNQAGESAKEIQIGHE